MTFWKNLRKKTKNSALPGSVESYYEEETPSSAVADDNNKVAVILGVFTLCFTVLIAGIIFFWGRAIFRNTSSSEKSQTVSLNKNNPKTKDQNANTNNRPESGNTDNKSTNNSNPTKVFSDSRIVPRSSHSEQMPPTGDNLPDTGDPGR